jgi:outer membrane protein assembly factor BamB
MQVATGDVNDDGFLDIAFYDRDDYLLIIDGRSGHLIWTSTAPIRQQNPLIRTSPVLIDHNDDGTVEVVYTEEGGWLNIVAGDTGIHIQRLFIGSISTTPKFVDVDGDGSLDILVGSMASEPNPTLTCLSGRTFSTLWTYKGPFQMGRVPAIGNIDNEPGLEIILTGGRISGGGTPYYSFRASPEVVLLDARTGKVRWNTTLPGAVTGFPSVVDLDSDQEMEILVVCDCGLIVLDSNGRIVDERSHDVDGYYVAGNWDSDDGLEVFIRTFDGISELGFIVYDDSHVEYLLPTGDTHTISLYTLIDLDSDGELEIFYDSYGPGGRYSLNYIDSQSPSPNLLMTDAHMVALADLDSDGLTELLVFVDGALTLLDENDPIVSVTMSGLHRGEIAYPETLDYTVQANITFKTPGFDIQDVAIRIENGSVGTSIEFLDDCTEGLLQDTMNGSLSLVTTDVRDHPDSLGMIYESILNFEWDYPVEDTNWLSVTLTYNDGLTIHLDKGIQFRLEKGLELMGEPVLTTADDILPPGGKWFANGDEMVLEGLSVVHRGSEDLLAPDDVAGVRIGTDDLMFQTVPRDEMGSRIRVEFSASIENGSARTFDAWVELIDLVPGAISESQVGITFGIDGQAPVIHTPTPSNGSWINSSYLICSIHVGDSNGSGMYASAVEMRRSGPDGIDYWQPAELIEKGTSMWLAVGSLKMLEDGVYHLEWTASDAVGNEANSLHLTIGRDTVAPEVDLDLDREWYNETSIEFKARVVDFTSGILDDTIHYQVEPVGSSSKDWVSRTVGTNGYVDIDVEVTDSKRYRLALRAQDKAGNQILHIVSFYVDLENPVIIPMCPWIINSTNGLATFPVILDDLGGSGFDGSILYFQFDGSTDWEPLVYLHHGTRYVIEVDIPIASDIYIRFKVFDRAGNPSLRTDQYLINLNEAPTALISQPENGDEFFDDTTITFDGSKSSDPESQSLTYQWVLDGEDVDLSQAVSTFKIPPGMHTLVLIVSDGYNKNQSDEIVFIVNEGPIFVSSQNILILLIICTLVILIIFSVLRKRAKDPDR